MHSKEANKAQPQISHRNMDVYEQIEWGMQEKGSDREQKQCCAKAKELWQAYQKAREANSQLDAEPQICHFYKELHAVLEGNPTSILHVSKEPESLAPGVNSEEEEKREDGGCATVSGEIVELCCEPGPVWDSTV